MMMKLDFNKKIILENDVVRLEPLEITAYDNLECFALNEPNLWEYSLIAANGKENMSRYIERAIEARRNEDSYPFLVYDKRIKAFAGSTRFYDYQKNHKTIQLGYTWYGKEFQGTGLNKNCKLLMLQFAFEELELERVEFRADNNNKRSIAAMKSIGCTQEGVLRNNCSSPDGRRDSIVLSILKEEWNADLKSRLLKKCKMEIERNLS